ncbi:DUF6896 domain-containing protein [Actinoallomurus soli]|uniref:DUF6896 domain-containing protein n=1 Tax=Actinoallomurus soli TaxID=2952535 RepID=UPI0020934C04|nr:hypothetical protein [Actinoallomurus soli]MCO5974364.1 hypothetical protein [Actinoallomurus soli]
MDADEVLLRFLGAMERLTGAVIAATAHDIGSEGGIGALVRAVNRRLIPRNRELPGGLRYDVHGFGCRITDRDGVLIDVDLGPEPEMLIFDAWRVRRFAQSIGEESVTELELSATLEKLAGEGILIVAPTRYGVWYAAPPPSER